jgi:hypothetical protein
MPQNRLLAGVVLLVVALVSALAVVLVTRGGGDTEAEATPGQTDPIEATGTFAPRVVLFGDTLTARVDVVLDRTVLDPDHVTVTWAHTPWKLVEPPRLAREDSGSTTFLRTTYVLRCLTGPCAPVRDTEDVDFSPARVTYSAPVGESTRRLSVDVPWPQLVLHTRVGDLDSGQRDALAAPWRADLVSLPLVSYRASPGLFLGLLLIAGVLLVLTAAVLAYRAIPERVPPPEPEPPPPPVASPLEQALALLESPAAANGAQDRRRALELVADEVERLGDGELAHAARALAWSEDVPEGDVTRAFAARLRRRMESLNGVPA